jgi:two-component system OmpR family sensor kinase
VLAIAALTALAVLLANVAGVMLLRSYLTDKVDEQLSTLSGMFSRMPRPPPSMPRPPPVPPGFPRGEIVYQYGSAGTFVDVAWHSAHEMSPPRLESFAAMSRRAQNGRPFTVEAVDGQGHWRVLVVPRLGREGGLTVAAISLHQVEATADRLIGIDAAVSLVILLLLGLAASAVVRIGMRPLTRMEAISAEIAAGDLSRRVDGADPRTEVGRLGVALNAMLSRIEAEVAARTGSEDRLRQFVADASHELRTPLTSIRGFAELYRRGGAPRGAQLDEAMDRIEAEAARMGLLVEDLLLLARLDQRRPLQRRPVDLLEIATDTIRDAQAWEPGRRIELFGLDDRCETFEAVTVLGDEHRLRQVAMNLVVNALRHTPSTARITVRVGRLSPVDRRCAAEPAAAVGDPLPAGRYGAVLEVIDDGPGVPADYAQRIFERLYRVDSSRTRLGNGGSGLGLSIVGAIVRSHGGRVELDTSPGRGATFRVLLPAAPKPGPAETPGSTAAVVP